MLMVLCFFHGGCYKAVENGFQSAPLIDYELLALALHFVGFELEVFVHVIKAALKAVLLAFVLRPDAGKRKFYHYRWKMKGYRFILTRWVCLSAEFSSFFCFTFQTVFDKGIEPQLCFNYGTLNISVLITGC